MTSILTKLNNYLKNIFLPVLALGSYLFYLLWSAPVSLILQEYDVSHWYITNNPLTPIITIVLIVFIVLLSFFISLKQKKCFNFFIGIILFLLILSFMYNHVLAYNYGSFLDNNNLIPEKPLLGFSKWYYLLDLIFIFGSLYLVYISIKKNLYIPIFLFFLLFYSTENIITISKTSNSINNTVSSTQKYTLSKNKKNVLLLVFDGFDPRIVQYFLTNNSLTKEQTSWSKDFKFYNNVTSFSSVTAGSIRSMFEGYAGTPQFILQELLSNSFSFSYFYNEPIMNFNQNLKQENISVYKVQSSLITSLPILSIFFYHSMPYMTRHFIANNNSWKIDSPNLWTGFSSSEEIDTSNTIITNTMNHTYFINWSEYSHLPWSATNSPVTYEKALTNLQAMELLRLHNTKDVFENIIQTIQFLKKHNIYDNTKIIVASDHGSHGSIEEIAITDDSMSPDKSLEFISKIATDPPKNPTDSFKRLPSLLMIKDFNTIQNKMTIDNRFLSLADLPSIIEHSLDISTILNKDYTKELPPQRVFNAPNVNFFTLLNNQKKFVQEFKQAGTVEFIQIHNVSPYKESFFTVPLQDITNVPSYEVIE